MNSDDDDRQKTGSTHGMTEQELIFNFTGDYDQDNPSEFAPVPSYEFKPDWFRKLPAVYDEQQPDATTLKTNRMFTDPFDLGYTIPSPSEIKIGRHGHSVGGMLGGQYVERCAGQSEQVSSENSNPSNPNAIIYLPWTVELPDDYGLLLTSPFNRSFDSVGVCDLFIPIDEMPPKLPVPVNLPEGVTTFNPGEYLVQAIPLYRPSLGIPMEVQTKSECDGFAKHFGIQQRRGVANPRDYRENRWIQKSKPSISKVSSSDHVSKTSTTNFEDQSYYCIIDSEHSRFIPKPQKANSIENTITIGANELEISHGKLHSWMKNAADIGYIYTSPFDIEIKISPLEEDPIQIISSYSSGGNLRDPIQTLPLGKLGKGTFSDLFCHIELNILLKTIAPPNFSTLWCEPLNRSLRELHLFTQCVDNESYIYNSGDDAINSPSKRFNYIDPGLMTGYLETEGYQQTMEIPKHSPLVQLLPIHRGSLLTEAGVNY